METYRGNVKTPGDAIILFEACRIGHLPRVQRRLSEKERQQIRSGSVFVWDEREAGMRRWTDGKSWSASRVSGSFLTYREMEGKRGSNSFNSPSQPPEKPTMTADMDPADGPDGYRYKPDGLMKQSFSITTSLGQHLHLISYIARTHPTSSVMPQPTTDPALRSIRPEKGMYPESTMHDVPGAPGTQRSPLAGSPYGTSPGSGRAGHAQNYLRHTNNPRSALHQMPGAGPYGWPPSPMDTPPNHYNNNQSPYIASPAVDANGVPSYGSHPAHSTQFDRPPPNIGSRALPPMGYQGAYGPPSGHQYPPPPEPYSHRYAPQQMHAPPYGGPPGASPYPPTPYSALPPQTSSAPFRHGDHPADNRLPALMVPSENSTQYPQQLPPIHPARTFHEPSSAAVAYHAQYANGNGNGNSSAISNGEKLQLPQLNGNNSAAPHISPILSTDRTPPKNIPSISALINKSPSPRVATMVAASATTPTKGKLPSPSSIAAIVNGEVPRAQKQPKTMPSMQAPSLHPAEDIAGRDKGLLRAMDRRCLLN